MRLLHTSDWHLGKTLGRISRHTEQESVLEEICSIADREEANVVLVAGDLFDTYNPDTESVELFYRTLKKLTADGLRAVIAIAGNHDSPDRIEAPDPLARECGIIFIGYPETAVRPFRLAGGLEVTSARPGFLELMHPAWTYPLRILATPYANEVRLRTALSSTDPDAHLRTLLQSFWKDVSEACIDNKGVNISVAHLYVMKKGSPPPEEPEDEKPIGGIGGAQAVFVENFPKCLQYVALGHLHRGHVIANSPCPIAYCGSPLAYSMSEAEQKKCVFIIDVEPSRPAQVREVVLASGKTLYRKKFSGVTAAIAWLEKNRNSLVELTMETDDYLNADQRKSLYDAHDGIVDIIPCLHETKDAGSQQQIPNRLRPIEDLFFDYFLESEGQKPNSELLTLFDEIRGRKQ